MNIAAILAGGIGSRAEAGMPKQFLDMAGSTLIERTIEPFENHPGIDEIVVVAHPDHIERLNKIREEGGYQKWHSVIAGGRERFLSSYAAVQACSSLDGNILIHDAARPFVTATLIDNLLKELQHHQAVIPAIALSDTLLAVTGSRVLRAEQRQNFRLAQTPQAFRLPAIRKAFAAAINDTNCCVTDDCGIIIQYGETDDICFIDGDINNQKLTYHSDIERFNKIFAENSKNRL